jgi:hypothetical protein
VTFDDAYLTAPLMKVRGGAGERVHFQDRAAACPTSGACPWRRRGYVVGGDVVFASAPGAGFRCVYVGTPEGEIVAGFLPDDRLEPAAGGGPLSPEFLTGRWKRGEDAQIAFSQAKGRVVARGHARYGEGASMNLGTFEAPVEIEGPRLTYQEEEIGCHVTAVRRGPYLVVEDESRACFGFNVSFTGIYVRTKR